VEDYLLRIIRATRENPTLEVGASPRAALALARAAQAYAAVQGRGFVKPDDVRLMTGPVLAHRVISTAQADLLGQSTQALISEIVEGIPVPVESGNVV
jgi:MoxR-like ATPase